MKKLIFIVVQIIFIKIFFFTCQNRTENKIYKNDTQEHLIENNTFQEGDIIFQTSLSTQSQAIQLATDSPYSHCGIIYKNQGKFFVFEAIQPVTSTPLKDWIKRGKEQKYVVKRLKNASKLLTQEKINEIKQFAQKWQGKNYDIFFGWSDEKLYCSELIWKIYKRGLDIEVGKLEKLKDFNLSAPLVKAKLKQRYGKHIPYDELVISPASIFQSELLETIENIKLPS